MWLKGRGWLEEKVYKWQGETDWIHGIDWMRLSESVRTNVISRKNGLNGAMEQWMRNNWVKPDGTASFFYNENQILFQTAVEDGEPESIQTW